MKNIFILFIFSLLLFSCYKIDIKDEINIIENDILKNQVLESIENNNIISENQIHFDIENQNEINKDLKESDKNIKERIEAVNGFKIENCEIIAKEKYIHIKDIKKSNEFNYEYEVTREREFCEQAYAFQYGCELLLEKTKKQKCLDMKDFQKKYIDLERYQNFVIGTYLK